MILVLNKYSGLKYNTRKKRIPNRQNTFTHFFMVDRIHQKGFYITDRKEKHFQSHNSKYTYFRDGITIRPTEMSARGFSPAWKIRSGPRLRSPLRGTVPASPAAASSSIGLTEYDHEFGDASSMIEERIFDQAG